MPYEADVQTVHQSIVSLTIGYLYEDWVKLHDKFKDVRKSMKALKDHFSCDRNATRRVEMLHYKSERQLTFENFVTKLQKMYNIYETHGEPMTEEAKIRFLKRRLGMKV